MTERKTVVAEISIYKSGRKYSARIDTVNGKSFLFSPVYRGLTRDSAYKKAVKNAARMADDWAKNEKIAVEV